MRCCGFSMSTTGLPPFYSMYCREPVMPAEMFLPGEEQSTLLHELIQHRITRMRQAEKARLQVYAERCDDVKKRKKALSRTLRFREGQYVMIKREPSKCRARKLDHSHTGPWLLVAALGSDIFDDEPAVLFLCQQMPVERRVKLRKLHSSRMRLWQSRPESLQEPFSEPTLTSQEVQALPEEERPASIHGRR